MRALSLHPMIRTLTDTIGFTTPESVTPRLQKNIEIKSPAWYQKLNDDLTKATRETKEIDDSFRASVAKEKEHFYTNKRVLELAKLEKKDLEKWQRALDNEYAQLKGALEENKRQYDTAVAEHISVLERALARKKEIIENLQKKQNELKEVKDNRENLVKELEAKQYQLKTARRQLADALCRESIDNFKKAREVATTPEHYELFLGKFIAVGELRYDAKKPEDMKLAVWTPKDLTKRPLEQLKSYIDESASEALKANANIKLLEGIEKEFLDCNDLKTQPLQELCRFATNCKSKDAQTYAEKIIKSKNAISSNDKTKTAEQCFKSYDTFLKCEELDFLSVMMKKDYEDLGKIVNASLDEKLKQDLNKLKDDVKKDAENYERLAVKDPNIETLPQCNVADSKASSSLPYKYFDADENAEFIQIIRKKQATLDKVVARLEKYSGAYYKKLVEIKQQLDTEIKQNVKLLGDAIADYESNLKGCNAKGEMDEKHSIILPSAIKKPETAFNDLKKAHDSVRKLEKDFSQKIVNIDAAYVKALAMFGTYRRDEVSNFKSEQTQRMTDLKNKLNQALQPIIQYHTDRLVETLQEFNNLKESQCRNTEDYLCKRVQLHADLKLFHTGYDDLMKAYKAEIKDIKSPDEKVSSIKQEIREKLAQFKNAKDGVEKVLNDVEITTQIEEAKEELAHRELYRILRRAVSNTENVAHWSAAERLSRFGSNYSIEGNQVPQGVALQFNLCDPNNKKARSAREINEEFRNIAKQRIDKGWTSFFGMRDEAVTRKFYDVVLYAFQNIKVNEKGDAILDKNNQPMPAPLTMTKVDDVKKRLEKLGLKDLDTDDRVLSELLRPKAESSKNSLARQASRK